MEARKMEIDTWQTIISKKIKANVIWFSITEINDRREASCLMSCNHGKVIHNLGPKTSGSLWWGVQRMCREECEAESVSPSQVVVTGSMSSNPTFSCHMCWVNIQSEWVTAGTPGVTPETRGMWETAVRKDLQIHQFHTIWCDFKEVEHTVCGAGLTYPCTWT